MKRNAADGLFTKPSDLGNKVAELSVFTPNIVVLRKRIVTYCPLALAMRACLSPFFCHQKYRYSPNFSPFSRSFANHNDQLTWPDPFFHFFHPPMKLVRQPQEECPLPLWKEEGKTVRGYPVTADPSPPPSPLQRARGLIAGIWIAAKTADLTDGPGCQTACIRPFVKGKLISSRCGRCPPGMAAGEHLLLMRYTLFEESDRKRRGGR